MTTELAPYTTAGGGSREIGRLTEGQIEIIRRTIARNASKDELSMFFAACERSGLDPMPPARHIYLVPRQEKIDGAWVKSHSVQVSIDGLRLIASRTGEYEGQTEPQWCGNDGVWSNIWLDDANPPLAARVGVYRRGFREPAYGVAKYSAYVQKTNNDAPTSFWKRMPDHMLAKCAESLALRKAFPNETSGLYTAEETGAHVEVYDAESQVISEAVDAVPSRAALPDPDAARKRFFAVCRAQGLTTQKAIHEALGMPATEGLLKAWCESTGSWDSARQHIEDGRMIEDFLAGEPDQPDDTAAQWSEEMREPVPPKSERVRQEAAAGQH